MRIPRPRVAIVAAAALTACGGTAAGIVAAGHSAPATSSAGTTAHPTGPPPAATGRAWLRELGSDGPTLAVVDLPSGRVVHTLADGVVGAGWARMYTTADPQHPGELVTLDPHTSTVVARRTIPAGLEVPRRGLSGEPSGLSPGGRWLVLSGGVRTADGRLIRTDLLVTDTRGVVADRAVHLDGDFRFDGIDDSGNNLFLLENQTPLGSTNGPLYQVRRYRVDQGSLDPTVIVDKTDGGAAMGGVDLTHVVPPGGAWQLTAYAFGTHGPFVHVLNLDNAWAVCLDLPTSPTPQSGADELDLLWSLAPAADGSRVFAVNGGTGQVVEIDLNGGSPPQIGRKGSVDLPASTPAASSWLSPVIDAEAKRLLSGGAVLSADGRSLYAVGADSVLVIDTATLTLRSRLLPGTAASGLALTAAGMLLVTEAAGNGTGQLEFVDPVSGASATALRAGTDLVGIARVEATQ